MPLPDQLSAVELRSVRKQFDKQVVLDDVNLTVASGEFFAILGASGSGKSTLLKLVSGIEVPDAGQVLLGNQDVTAVPPYRRPVHTVFQNFALFPHLDVAGNVGFPLKIAGVARKERQVRIQEVLSWVRMERFSARSVGDLSGGERQRVALARALVDEPKCVLLDEPLSALDPHLRTQTLELLRDIQARVHATYLYVTHDREEAMRAAHRIGVLHHGRLAQVGTPEDLYRRPTSPYVAGFIGKMNWLRGVVVTPDNRPRVRLDTGQEVPCGPAVPPQSTRVLLGMRPEEVRMGVDGFLPAKVIDRHFAGAVMVFRLEVSPGVELAAEVRIGAPMAEIGTRVQVSWEPANAHLFADAEGAGS